VWANGNQAFTTAARRVRHPHEQVFQLFPDAPLLETSWVSQLESLPAGFQIGVWNGIVRMSLLARSISVEEAWLTFVRLTEWLRLATASGP
jgi:hypothetical protein